MSSMAALAARFIAKRLIMGATIAEGNVQDSAIDPLRFLDDGKSVPVVVVSSEDETSLVSGRDVNTGERTATLTIETAIGQAGTIAIPGEGDAQAFNIGPTDAAAEALLTVLQRQISRALFGGTGDVDDLFKVFVPSVSKITVKRGIPTEQGAKFAARLIEIEYVPLNDPPFGTELPPAWVQFLAFVEAQEGVEPRQLFESALIGAPIAPEMLAQAALGLTTGEAKSLRLEGF